MKESKFYHRALDLSLLDGKAVKAALEKEIERKSARGRERIGFPWRKVGMAAAAGLLLFITTIMAIPSTRAEVLSWLGIISRPQDYLTAR